MAVPSGSEPHAFACKIVVLDDDVFEDLVKRMTDMDMSVGIGRSVMKSEVRRAFALLLHFCINILLEPFCITFRFVLREIASHSEGRFR